MTGALDGIVVADLSRVLAGPYATQLLADLGADVFKVESPAGDETRHWMPPETGGVSTYYLSVNRGKRSVVLDFADPDDRGTAHRLVARADVVIENFRPGALARFGLDHASVAKLNPAVVYCSISGFGSGAGAALPGYDLIVQAMSGLMSMTGAPDGDPQRSAVSVFDVMTGMNAVIGILAALRHRDRTGEGQHVEVNLLSTALAAMANHAVATVATGAPPRRWGNAHPSLFPYEPLPTSDGLLVVVAANDRQFARLAETLGHPEWVDDARFASSADRNTNREALRRLLTAALATRTSADWFAALTAAGVPCGPINTLDEGIALAERLGLNPVLRLGADGADGAVGAIPGIHSPLRLSATPPRYRGAPPVLGEHTATVRDELRDETRGGARDG